MKNKIRIFADGANVTEILKLKRKTGQSEDIDRTVSNLRQIIFSRRQTQTGLDKLKEERNVSSANFKNLSAEEKIDFKKEMVNIIIMYNPIIILQIHRQMV